MTFNGTSKYENLPATQVPPKVREAVAAAKELDFGFCVHPATGRLLQALAAGVPEGGRIGETGTGTGAGVGWLLSNAHPSISLVSIEIDAQRSNAAERLFGDDDRVTIVNGDANELDTYGPFDLLVLDGPAGDGPLSGTHVDPGRQLKPNGLLVNDDLWPMTQWPPLSFDGSVDTARVRLLEHPSVFATEVTVAEGYSAVLARRRP